MHSRHLGPGKWVSGTFLEPRKALLLTAERGIPTHSEGRTSRSTETDKTVHWNEAVLGRRLTDSICFLATSRPQLYDFVHFLLYTYVWCSWDISFEQVNCSRKLHSPPGHRQTSYGPR